MEPNLISFKLDRVMTPEQSNQIIEAIISGKYSWACVLILRFAGYNPLHYIPRRTYNRLIKENKDNLVQRSSKEVLATSTVESKSSRKSKSSGNSSRHLEELSYLEDLKNQSTKVSGSNGWLWSQF